MSGIFTSGIWLLHSILSTVVLPASAWNSHSKANRFWISFSACRVSPLCFYMRQRHSVPHRPHWMPVPAWDRDREKYEKNRSSKPQKININNIKLSDSHSEHEVPSPENGLRWHRDSSVIPPQLKAQAAKTCNAQFMQYSTLNMFMWESVGNTHTSFPRRALTQDCDASQRDMRS